MLTISHSQGIDLIGLDRVGAFIDATVIGPENSKTVSALVGECEILRMEHPQSKLNQQETEGHRHGQENEIERNFFHSGLTCNQEIAYLPAEAYAGGITNAALTLMVLQTKRAVETALVTLHM